MRLKMSGKRQSFVIKATFSWYMNWKLWVFYLKTNNTKEIVEQMENYEFDDEINDKDIVLDLLEFSTVPMLYRTENKQKDNDFYRRAVKLSGMTIAWDAYDVCDSKIILDAIKHPYGFRFLKCLQRNDEEIASWAMQLYLEDMFSTDYDRHNPRNRMVRKNKVLLITNFKMSTSPLFC